MDEIRFTDGFRPRKATATTVAAELERIQQAKGELSAEAIFEASRPKKAPLHDEFTWDTKAAVRELGLIRARQLARSVIVIRKDEPELPPRHIWVNVPSRDDKVKAGIYEKLEIVASNTDLYPGALKQAQSKADAALDAVNELRAAAREANRDADLQEIDRVADRLAEVRDRLATITR